MYLHFTTTTIPLPCLVHYEKEYFGLKICFCMFRIPCQEQAGFLYNFILKNKIGNKLQASLMNS